MKSGSIKSKSPKNRDKSPYKNSFQGDNYYRKSMLKLNGQQVDNSNNSKSEMWIN